MRSMYSSTFSLVAGFVLTSACYATKSVRSEDFRAIGGNLRDARSLPTPSEGPAILDAEALVRLSPGGGSTDWIPASSLSVSDDVLYVETEIADVDIAMATVSNLSPEQVDRLRIMAPRGGIVAQDSGSTSDSCRLTVAEPKTLLPWVGRFVTEQRAAGAYEGAWLLEKRKAPFWRGQGRPRPFPVSFANLEGPLTGDERLFVAHGVPWSKLKSIGINYLHPLYSVLAVPLAPLLFLGGSPDDGRERANPFGPAVAERQVWRRAPSDVQPLFAWQGMRRAILKLVGGIDAGAEYGGSFFSTASVGVRFRNMFEFAFLVRELSKVGGTNEARGGHTLMGAAAGVHIDGDGDPSFAFYVGAEGLGYLGGGQDQVMSLVFGPRFGFKNGLQLMVVPFSATSLCRTDERGRCAGGPGGMYSSIQVGFAY